MNRIVFLGTGGGRHMMFSQLRKTGGMYFELGDDKNGLKFVMDPGPGSLVNARSAKLKAEGVEGVVLSHHHIDHSTDANVWLDGLEKPFLIAEEHCVMDKAELGEKDYDYYPCVSPYQRKRVGKLHAVRDRGVVKMKGIRFEAVKSEHYGPTVGFIISTDKFRIGCTSDGRHYPGQESRYEGCNILIMNVLVPKGVEPEEKKHMSVDEAIKFIRGMKKKPKLVILQHFSLWMLRANLWKQEKIMKDATGVQVIHADDFMQVDIDKILSGNATQDDL
ncbi:MAG: MBL fold metallo-hydrolase [Candidatus Aenigmarchaeota archaeon]|nr:MBL fold metallo-hydrolase [Candidatus Aenigmarchaeota archaeon]